MTQHRHHAIAEGYQLDQICKIGACGLLGGIVLVIWKADLLSKFQLLTDQFIVALFFGGVLLLVLTALRAVTLWSAALRSKRHEADYHHHHGDCDHTKDDGHEHGFAPWRYAVLSLPLLLSGMVVYFHLAGLNLAYSAEYLIDRRSPDLPLADETDVAEQEGVWTLGFTELSDAAISRNPAPRQTLQGRVRELTGLFMPISENQFTLTRLKQTCCPADAVPVNVRIISRQSLDQRGLQPGKGVRVRGKIDFRKIMGREQYVPVMILRSANDVSAEDIGNDIWIKGS